MIETEETILKIKEKKLLTDNLIYDKNNCYHNIIK